MVVLVNHSTGFFRCAGFCVILIWTVSGLQAQSSLTIGIRSSYEKPPFTVQGKIYDLTTGEPLLGANIYIERQEIGTSSDVEGNYTLRLYEGLYAIRVSSTGYETVERKVDVIGSGRLNFGLNVKITQLAEMVIRADQEDGVVNKPVGTETMSAERIKTLPNVGGEADIIRSMTLLPGVSTPGEATGGFNVRGGGFDQNLVLLDGATIYNPNHMFGFISSMNANMVGSATLFKGAIPAYYGGRGSSVLDITYQKGNFSEWETQVNLGILSSKIATGGPLIKEKLSTSVGLRSSYVNWLFQNAREGNVHNSHASFRDGNLILSYALNKNNEVEYSFYRSFDSFQFADDNSTEWSNTAQVLKYTSVLNDRWTVRISGIQSRYKSVIINREEFQSFDLHTGVKDYAINGYVRYNPSEQHEFRLGGQYKQLRFNPGKLDPVNNSSVQPERVSPVQALESALFIHHDFNLIRVLKWSYGLRWSHFSLDGPGTINQYAPKLPRSTSGITGQREYGRGDVIQAYQGFEPRAGLSINFSENQAIKLGFNRMYQYLHLISNTSSIAPTDTWRPSDPFLKPEIIDQFSAGYFSSWGPVYEASVEGYYKNWQNVVEYKDGARLFLNRDLETELITGVGKSYGLEVYLKKNVGRLNGWLSYSYSRSLRKMDGRFESETINDGQWYPSSFDKPHNFTLVNNYRLGPNLMMSYIFTYSTGRPVTLPQGKFRIANNVVGYFDVRSNDRIPDYHRLDVSFHFRFPSDHPLLSGMWNLSLYNLYGQDNAFSVFYKDTFDGPPEALKLVIIGRVFPSLSYEFSF